MTKITLEFEETDKGLVAMKVQTRGNNPTEKEEIVCSQMAEHIFNGNLKSPTVARGCGGTLEEAQQKAEIEGDIYLANRGISEVGPI